MYLKIKELRVGRILFFEEDKQNLENVVGATDLRERERERKLGIGQNISRDFDFS